jgi:hypothetical protein
MAFRQYRSGNDQFLCLVSARFTAGWIWLTASSIYEGGAAKVLENSEGARTTPSVVAFTKGPSIPQSSSLL